MLGEVGRNGEAGEGETAGVQVKKRASGTGFDAEGVGIGAGWGERGGKRAG